jgi:hypothetical protein
MDAGTLRWTRYEIVPLLSAAETDRWAADIRSSTLRAAGRGGEASTDSTARTRRGGRVRFVSGKGVVFLLFYNYQNEHRPPITSSTAKQSCVLVPLSSASARRAASAKLSCGCVVFGGQPRHRPNFVARLAPLLERSRPALGAQPPRRGACIFAFVAHRMPARFALGRFAGTASRLVGPGNIVTVSAIITITTAAVAATTTTTSATTTTAAAAAAGATTAAAASTAEAAGVNHRHGSRMKRRRRRARRVTPGGLCACASAALNPAAISTLVPVWREARTRMRAQATHACRRAHGAQSVGSRSNARRKDEQK